MAGVAVGLELDRQSRDMPTLAAAVPEPFRNFALETLVDQGTTAGKDHKGTLAQAETLLRRRPVPAENLTLLSQAAYAAGDPGLSDKALLLSAGRGWRDLLTQQAMVSAAMSSGETDIAVDRLTALWNVGAHGDPVANETARVISDPKARAAFAKRLAQSDLWNNAFLAWGVTALPTDAYAQTIAAAIDAGGDFECQRLSLVAGAMIHAGAVGPASSIWRGPCAAATKASPEPFTFSPQQWGANEGPFDWDYPQAAGVSVSLREDGGHYVVDYINSDALTHVIARRYTRFAAGTYKLAAKGDLPPGPSVVLRVRCIGAGGVQGGAVRLSMSENDTISFDIPAKDCPAQMLEIVVSRGKGTGLRLVKS